MSHRAQPKKRLSPSAAVPHWFLDAKRAGADEAVLLQLTRDFCRSAMETPGEPDEGWVRVMLEMYENAYRLALTS